jgi:hypothetical protein
MSGDKCAKDEMTDAPCQLPLPENQFKIGPQREVALHKLIAEAVQLKCVMQKQRTSVARLRDRTARSLAYVDFRLAVRIAS